MSFKSGVIQSPGSYRIPYPQNMAPNRSVLGQHLSYLHSNTNVRRAPTNVQSQTQAIPVITPNNNHRQLQQQFRPSLVTHAISPPPTGPSKGLLNGPGQNNCFLNCAVQVSVFPYFFFCYL